MRGFEEQAAAVCAALLGEQPDRVTFPAGRSRRSARVHLPDRTVIVTARRNPARAAHECHILRALGAAGAPVPAVLAWRDGWLIQEDVGSTRLTHRLLQGTSAEIALALDAALDALARCQAAGRQAGLSNGRALLGMTAEWRAGLVATPERLGVATGIAAPSFDAARLAERIRPPSVTFIKWDARPGNAILRDDGRVFWFDWEHAGLRAPLDDLVWLLGDEFLGGEFPGGQFPGGQFPGEEPDLETEVLARWGEVFSDGIAQDEAHDYLVTMLCLHASVRLSRILSYHRRDGRWWDRDRLLRDDLAGVDRACALALCVRARRWADQTGPTRPLAGWFDALGDLVRTLA